MSSRVLVLSAEFGSGHLAAAKAIAAACRSVAPDCAAEPVQVHSPLLTLFTGLYLWLIKRFPSLYRWLYHQPVRWPLRAVLVLCLGRIVTQEIRRLKPDVIIGTHPFPAGVAAYLRRTGRLKVPVLMALTDFLPHNFWVWEGVDRYCVGSERAAQGLRAAGVDPGRISVTGVAIRPEFTEASQADRGGSLRAQPPVSRRVLVMGGGLGLGPIVEAVRSLAALPHPDLQIVVICGRNHRLMREVEDLFGPDPRIQVVGFIDHVAEQMLKSDLLVTKPGGITCSEAMAVGLPMLLLSPLPGHEEENAAYLVETGAALVTDESGVGVHTTELLFEHPDRLRTMVANARKAAHPRAAEAVANQIFTRPAQDPHLSTTVG